MTIASLIGLVVFGALWVKASDKVWYIDTDNDPVSFKSIISLLWMICLCVLILKIFK